jgi:CheY-like chemotaxis protein
VREYAGHALNAGQQLLQLVDHVLDLQRLDEGRLELRIEAVAVGPLVAQAVDAVREQAQARGIRLSNEIARDGIYVRADRERLLQVLTALSNNAVKYNRPTGTVCWRAERRDDRATLIVEDSGSGMTDAQLTRLFQPFERLGRETGTVEGSGLGLIIARSLAENMGGRLSVSSRFGLGTRAIVELPLAAVEPQAAASTAAAAPPAAAATPTPLRLLYVEDNRVNALLFGEAVRVLGNVELRVAEDGSEALETVRHWQPDVLVLDAHLPGSSGFQVLEQLRGMPGLERTPAVMCSADALPDDVERARAAGFIGYWTKPIDLGRVMAELQQFAAR